MADSLVLKGVKDVRKHTGTEMQLVIPRRGGNTHQTKEWWRNGVNTPYCSCTLFRVTTSGGTVYLALETGSSERSVVKIQHDGDANFTFSQISQLKRAALFDEDKKLIEHYLFPSIVNGPIVTVTPPGAASRPSNAAVSFGSSTSISGTPTVGETLTATAATYTGGVGSVSTNLIFQVSDTGSGGWTFLAGNPDTAGGATATYTLQSGDAGKYIRASFQVTDDDGTKSSNSSATAPIASTFSSRVAAATFTYVVGVNNIGTAELPQNVYTLNGLDGPGIAGVVGDSFVFDYSAVSSEHPLGIFTDASKTTPVTVGVTVEGDVLLFEPPIAGSFSYQCINHNNMGGDITVSA